MIRVRSVCLVYYSIKAWFGNVTAWAVFQGVRPKCISSFKKLEVVSCGSLGFVFFIMEFQFGFGCLGKVVLCAKFSGAFLRIRYEC